MEDHVFAVWDFMSLLKRLQQDMPCVKFPWFPADNSRAALNDMVIGEATDIGPDGAYLSHFCLYLRAMREIGAGTRQFEKFRTMVLVGAPVEVAPRLTGVPSHVQGFVAHTMELANAGSTEEVLAAFFYGRGDVIPEMFCRLLNTLDDAKTTTITCVISSTTLTGTSNSTGKVMVQRGASCSKIWSPTRRKRASEFCVLRAAASRPVSHSGTVL